MSPASETPKQSPTAATDGRTGPALSPRVLILDDDAESWAPIIRSVQALGLGTLVRGADPSIVELVADYAPDVVVVESRGAVNASLELVARVKAASPRTEVVVIVTNPSVVDLVATYRVGAFDVVTRPFQASDVAQAILAGVEKRQSAQDAAVLLREGQNLLTVRDREHLPALAVDFARRSMKADVVSLMLKDTAGRLYIAHAHGLPADLLPGTRLQIGQRVAGRVAELRAPVLIDDALQKDERFEDLVPFGRVRSSIVHPLLAGERVMGILNIGRSTADQPFNHADLERAGVISGQISLALDTLRQWQRTGMVDRLAIVSQVAGSVAHEINNPLAALVGQTDLALESITGLLARSRPGSPLPVEDLRAALVDVRECLADAREAAASIEVVASDLRSAAQNDGTEEAVSNLAETVRAATRLATTEVRRQTTISRNVEPTLFVAGDSGLLCQVFLSLILNAHQALRAAATPRPEIRIASSQSNGEVRIDVIDNGPGVAPEHITRIFEPFYLEATSRLRPGLGLSIAHDIVQGLGGRMDVIAKPGEGTMFSVYLTVALTNDRDAEPQGRSFPRLPTEPGNGAQSHSGSLMRDIVRRI
jgi:signal transduction histidine kinase/ActR/RegA family two-component response regulator